MNEKAVDAGLITERRHASLHAAVKVIADDPQLLSLMIADANRSGPLWSPTAYWRGYAARIVRELDRNGLAEMRTNQTLLKGFASGGMPRPELPASPWKRLAWSALERLPGVCQILAEHNRILAAEYRRHNETRRQHARMAMDEIARAFPALRPPSGLANGGADDAFDWRSHTLVPAFVMYLSRAADFYQKVPPQEVGSILEIGPGLGLSSLAHMTLNPTLRVVVNVDIVPVLYLSTQFLKSIEGVDVVDYRALRERERIIPEAPAGGVRVYQLAAWQLPNLEGRLDFFFNAFSFQEMESEVCRNYAAHALRLVERGTLLLSMAAGHKPSAGGQSEPVTLAFLESLFRGNFPNVARLDGFWPRLFGGDTGSTRLMTR